MAAEQRPVVDDLGNIAVHGRSGLVLVVKIETATSGVYEDISASDLFFEISGKLRLALSAGADIYSRQVILTRAQVATLSIGQPYAFAIHDETPSTPSTPWAGTITTFGFKTAPTGVPDVDGEAANWTGATVVIQPGGGSPVAVVSYMGQPGEGVPIGGTAGQYLRKSSSTDYATGWDTITADDVSGLSSTLSTLTSADTSLATRISTEEAARASADTSLATAVAATYLPLAGGVMTGALAAVAGTAALPGLAVAGDVNTGIYGVSADVLGVSAGGLNAATFTNGQLSLATAAGGAGVTLAVDGANVLALRNGTNAQTLRINGTWGAAGVDYERLSLGYTGGDFRIATEQGGGGSARSLMFATGNTNRWFISGASGSLFPNSDATYDLGSAASRIRSGYFATNVVIGYSTTTAAQLHVGGGSALSVRHFGGGTLTPQMVNTQTSGIAAISVGVTDGVNNRRAAFVQDHTNGFWGLTNNYSTGAVDFVVRDTNTNIFSVTSTGVATHYGNLLFSADNSFDIGASGYSRARNIYAANLIGFDANNYLNLSSTYINFRVNGGDRVAIGPSAQVQTRSDGAFSWSSTTSPTGAGDLWLYRDAANTLALRNGANAQAFRVYSTYTDASNYERLGIFKSGSSYVVLTEQAGTGTALALRLGTVGAASAIIRTNNVDRLSVDSSGHFLPVADATYKLGDNAAQFIDAYLSRSVIISQAAIPAGGVAGRGLRFSSTANFGVFFGSGAPTLSAAKGSLYLRGDGSGTSDRMYVNVDGGTTWTAVITAA